MNSFTSPQSQDQLDAFPLQTADDEEINLYEAWKTLVEFKWTIVMVTLCCFTIATTVAFVMTPKYHAEILVAPAEEGKGSGGLAALAGQFGGLADMAGVNLGGSGGGKETAIAYLKSRVFIESYIKEKNLLPVLYARIWDASTSKWNVQDQKNIPTSWDAYQLFSKILSVTADKKTGLITLSVEWKDREQAVEWANDLIKRSNADLRQRAIADADVSLGYLEKELQKTSVVEVQQAIFKIMETQIKTRMMANVQEQFAFKVIDPAALMNENAYVKPNRPLLMALGLLSGLILGILMALILKAIQRRRSFA